jgi:hypothetical protein
MPSLSSDKSTDPKLPKSKPIDSLQEVDEWAPSSTDIFNIATVPYRHDSSGQNLGKPKLLLCHDMAGGKEFGLVNDSLQIIYNVYERIQGG